MGSIRAILAEDRAGNFKSRAHNELTRRKQSLHKVRTPVSERHGSSKFV